MQPGRLLDSSRWSRAQRRPPEADYKTSSTPEGCEPQGLPTTMKSAIPSGWDWHCYLPVVSASASTTGYFLATRRVEDFDLFYSSSSPTVSSSGRLKSVYQRPT